VLGTASGSTNTFNVSGVEAPPDIDIQEKRYKIEISFEELGLRLKGGSQKVILSGVTGSVRPFRVTAVMGPSGAGKTTFLSTLCGKASYGVTSGKLMINGVPDVPLSKFRRVMGFVPQEDVMHRVLTAREILTAQAALRLPSSVGPDERAAQVEQTIQLLDLEHVADSPIGDEETRGISGGQRKRVNIGMELVARPTLLFLDEPTSGLDSTSSFSVIRALRHVAERGGLTVAAVLHQPRFEIFCLFHDVLLLGPGGRTVYLGPSVAAKAYFEDHLGFEIPPQMNPADFYMDAIAGLYKPRGRPDFSTGDLFDAWRERGAAYIASLDRDAGGVEHAIDSSVPFERRVPPSFARQAVVCLTRCVLLQRRHAREIVLDMILVLIAGTFLGAIYPNVRLGQLMSLNAMSSLALGLLGMISSLRYFGDDKAVAWREASSGVNRPAFLLGTMVAHMPLILATPLLYVSMLYTFTAPRTDLADYYSVMLATFWATTGLGYMISVSCSQRTSQMACVVAALISSMLSGANPTLPTLDGIRFFGPLAYTCSYCRWFAEALFEREATRYSQVWLPQVTGFADHFGYTLDNFQRCVGVLWAFGFITRALTAAATMGLNRGKVA
jgi:ABC-type multidrug transport system ATPase subunit